MSAAPLPITGYLDRFSHRPGEAFLAHVSLREAGSFKAGLVRVISGDPNPAGPGMRFEDLARVFSESFKGKHQEISLGSYALIEPGPEREPDLPFTLTALVQLRAEMSAESHAKAVLALEGLEGAYVLSVGPGGAQACLSTSRKGASELRLGTKTPMKPGQWYRLWLAVDPASG
ncbi:MAG: hypothetical protein JOZ88_18980, partial [Hyphomicrobiales bacterium]|nr:hypothetical protein [Hyphomicrobiales bacterium]